MLIILNFALSLLIIPLAYAGEAYTLEKIVVTPKDDSFSSEVLGREYLKGGNLNSLTDVLNYGSGLDLRSRGAFGIQGDLSLRGSTYEQVAVLIDGVPFMDPQTGHHNLDIPLTLFDVERVEVTREGASSLYGSGALAGSVNMVIKKPTRKVFNLSTLFGEHALFGQALSLSLPGENLSSRFSFDHKISSGARPNTDFEDKTFSFYLAGENSGVSEDFLFGYQKKDFGASTFYSNLFPEEEEHTETVLVKGGVGLNANWGFWKNNLFLRKHRDKFILRRNNPTSVNYHTTYIYGLNSNFTFPLAFGDLLAGFESARDEIYSSNLGKHTRMRNAGLLGFIPQLPQKWKADFRLRIERYQKWAWQRSVNALLGYYLIDNKLKAQGSFAQSFRVPSFTELYYSDSGNKGNANLIVEEADNFRLGLDFQEKFLDIILEGFLRRGHNLIDWTREQSSDPWQATNLGQVDFAGLNFEFKLKPETNQAGFNEAKFSYTYTHVDKKAAGFLSKYALDILKHQLILSINQNPLGLEVNWQLSYNQRYYGETYFVGNVYVAKKFMRQGLIFEPFFSIDNFSNAKYSETGGVIQPGRWVKAGFKFEW